MEISTQDYGYSSSKITNTKTMESLEDKYGEKFGDYLKEFSEITADGELGMNDYAKYYTQPEKMQAFTEILTAKNEEGSNIIDGGIHEGAENLYPEEIQKQINSLHIKHAETGDVSYLWMAMEVGNQYNAYKNGEDVDSIFVVRKDGSFGSGNSSTINDKDVDTQKFVDKMLEIFTQKLGNSSGDLKDKYQDLVDNYQQMKDQIETNKTNSYRGSSFYA